MTEGLASQDPPEIQRVRQEVFIREVGPETWVFKDEFDHTLYGRTVGSKNIYVDPSSSNVTVEKILNRDNLSEQWPWENVIKMSDDEIKERLLR